jgi:hypothetical protein
MVDGLEKEARLLFCLLACRLAACFEGIVELSVNGVDDKDNNDDDDGTAAKEAWA